MIHSHINTPVEGGPIKKQFPEDIERIRALVAERQRRESRHALCSSSRIGGTIERYVAQQVHRAKARDLQKTINVGYLTVAGAMGASPEEVAHAARVHGLLQSGCSQRIRSLGSEAALALLPLVEVDPEAPWQWRVARRHHSGVVRLLSRRHLTLDGLRHGIGTLLQRDRATDVGAA